jgi:PAS domain S-box-containing protein
MTSGKMPMLKVAALGRSVWGPQLPWVVVLTLLLVFGHFLPASKFFTAPGSYLPFHSILEFVGMAVSVMVFALAWNLRSQPDNSHRMLLGAGFLAVSLIDIAHTLSYAGMPDLVTPSGTEKAINFWLAGRYVAAGVFLAIAVLPQKHWSMATCGAAVLAACGIAAAIWWVGIVHVEWLPRTFIPGEGLTALKIGAEYLLAVFYGTAAVLLFLKSRRRRYGDLAWLAAAAWVQGLAEMFFTLYVDVTDVFNLFGHIYKAIAYVMVYLAIFVAGVQAPYRELGLERARLKTLVASIPDLVWLKDKDGIYLSCNPAFERFFGVKEASIVGKSDYDFVDAQLADFFRKNDRAAIAAGESCANEEWLTFPSDGYHGLFETTKTPMYAADGQIIGVLGIAHDVTPRKVAEDEIRAMNAELEGRVRRRTAELENANETLTLAREAADTANVAKSSFLANMSHEIRTPLNAITGMAHLLRKTDVTARQAELLDKLDSASDHLLETLNAILDLSKIESGKFALEDVPLRVNDLLDEVLAMIQQRAHEKGLCLQNEMGALPRGLFGDATRLRQALLNYANNAIKFTPAGGVVTLRASQLEDDDSSVLLRFEVVDTGTGIAPEAMSRLFNPFEQADNSITRKYGGTGLGLVITQKIAQLMGGDAGAQSLPGVGSTFWLTVRLRKGSAAETTAGAGLDEAAEIILQRDHPGFRVLLAEDDPINREVALMMLDDVGGIVDIAVNGVEAVDLVRRNNYALILMDMQMPVMDGLEATSKIRQLPDRSTVPILAMTANAFVEDKQRCFAAGMNDFITKPVRHDQFYAMMLKWLTTASHD